MADRRKLQGKKSLINFKIGNGATPFLFSSFGLSCLYVKRENTVISASPAGNDHKMLSRHVRSSCICKVENMWRACEAGMGDKLRS